MSEVNKKNSSEGSTAAPKAPAKKAAPQALLKAGTSTVAKKSPVAAKKAPAKAPVRKAKVALKPAASAAEKAKKPKMVRDSFSIPKAEYAVLDALKLRSAKLNRPVKKTELLRAGIKVLAALSDTVFLAALKGVPSLKTGRPAKAKAAK